MRKKLEWLPENLDATTKRVKVLGGWLVTVEGTNSKGGCALTSCFVSDRNHEWIVLPPAPAVDESLPKQSIGDDFKSQPL